MQLSACILARDHAAAERRRLNTLNYGDLFTNRQLVALDTFSRTVHDAINRVKTDAVASGWADDSCALDAGGTGATAYAEPSVSTWP